MMPERTRILGLVLDIHHRFDGSDNDMPGFCSPKCHILVSTMLLTCIRYKCLICSLAVFLENQPSCKKPMYYVIAPYDIIHHSALKEVTLHINVAHAFLIRG